MPGRHRSDRAAVIFDMAIRRAERAMADTVTAPLPAQFLPTVEFAAPLPLVPSPRVAS